MVELRRVRSIRAAAWGAIAELRDGGMHALPGGFAARSRACSGRCETVWRLTPASRATSSTVGDFAIRPPRHPHERSNPYPMALASGLTAVHGRTVAPCGNFDRSNPRLGDQSPPHRLGRPCSSKERDMTRHTARARSSEPAALLVTAALALTGCGGSGFSGGSSPSALGGDSRRPTTRSPILIGSSGDAETAAVKTPSPPGRRTRASRPTVDGRERPATSSSSQGFAAGSPPDLFYLSADAIAGYAATARSRRTATC